MQMGSALFATITSLKGYIMSRGGGAVRSLEQAGSVGKIFV
jgi:hypothetical protein